MFTNMYKELDRGTQYFQNCLLSTTFAGYKPDLDGIDEDIVKETLWLWPKSLSQSTLAKSTLGQTQIPLPEYSGRRL